MVMSMSISLGTPDYSVSALEEEKIWLVSYTFTKPYAAGVHFGSVYVEAKTIVDAISSACDLCGEHMDRIVYEDESQDIEIHEWDGYQITDVKLCTSGNLV